MGMFMGMDDMYIEGLLEVLNLRFGAFPDVQDTAADTLDATEHAMRLNASGIREVQAIQAEFEVFRAGRPLVQSLRALGLGGHWNGALKRKWFKLLNRLDKLPSEDPALSGGQAIVAALVEHLKDLDPMPVHFKAHDAAGQAGGARVLIIRKDRPIFYIQKDFLTISIPMAARPQQQGGHP
jgi:hypothetical protein